MFVLCLFKLNSIIRFQMQYSTIDLLLIISGRDGLSEMMQHLRSIISWMNCRRD